jgi:hypothetical protein
MHTCIEERFEAEFEDGDSSEFILRLTKDVKSLREECQELLLVSGVELESTLMTALLNTIDYKNLMENLENQFEDELDELKKRIANQVKKELEKCDVPEVIYDKAAGIDKTDTLFHSCVSCGAKTTYPTTFQPADGKKFICNYCDSCDYGEAYKNIYRPDFFTIMAKRETARKEAKKCDGCGGSGTVALSTFGTRQLCDGCDSHFSTM